MPHHCQPAPLACASSLVETHLSWAACMWIVMGGREEGTLAPISLFLAPFIFPARSCSISPASMSALSTWREAEALCGECEQCQASGKVMREKDGDLVVQAYLPFTIPFTFNCWHLWCLPVPASLG